MIPSAVLDKKSVGHARVARARGRARAVLASI